MSKSLAANIEILMEKEGLSVTQLAHKIGMPIPTLHKIVNGKSTRLSPKSLIAISGYFKIPAPKLLKGEIEEHSEEEKIRHIPIIYWNSINSWLDGKTTKTDYPQTTPINLNVSEKSFALVMNDMVSTLFKPGSVLIFDPTLEVKDGTYVLVKLADYPDILLRQIVCDVSNNKHIKSLNQEFSANIRKLEQDDQIIAILLMSKTLFYYQ